MALFADSCFPAFNEVAAHDVKWGARQVPYADTEAWEGRHCFEKNHFVSVPVCLIPSVVN